MVQLKAYWRLEERDFTTLLQRHDVEVNDAVWSSIPNVATLQSCDTYVLAIKGRGRQIVWGVRTGKTSRVPTGHLLHILKEI